MTRGNFGLKHEDDCIFGQRNKDKYMVYQDDYRAEHGVFPELDRRNLPFTAMLDDPYLAYCELKKRGFWGALGWHDYHGFFNRRLKSVYHTYKREWSFLTSVGSAYRTYFTEIREMEPSEHIEDGLGYRKDANGNYYEGTWENGELVYGLVYIAAEKTVTVGSIHEGSVRELHGASLSIVDGTSGTVTTRLGIFSLSEDECFPYRSMNVLIASNVKKGEIRSITVTVGTYDEGYAEGRFYEKTLDGENITIGWAKYRDGEIKSAPNVNLDMLLHVPITLYMLPYYMIKFTYGLPIFPIYRAVQRYRRR